jgi:predicted ATP-dependent serine protease
MLDPQFDDTIFKEQKNGSSNNTHHLTAEELKKGVEDGIKQEHWFNPVNPFYEHVEPLEWILEMFAAKGMITTLGGVAGSGKSILVQYLLQLRNKQSLIDAENGTGIYLTGLDSSETEIRRRAKSIGNGEGLQTVKIPDEIIPYITNERFFHDLKDKLNEYDVDAIVFDTLADFHKGNLYEAADANATMTAFRRLAKTTGAAVILITHTRKSAEQNRRYTVNDIADSRIFGTKSDFVFAIKNEYKNDHSNLIELQCLKSRSPKNMPDLRALVHYDTIKGMVSIERSDRPFDSEAEDIEEKERIAERRRKAWHLHQQGKGTREIGKELGVSHTTINNDLKKYKKTVSSE